MREADMNLLSVVFKHVDDPISQNKSPQQKAKGA